ncbi:Glucose-6-phosphate 1-epimerase [Chlorella sorokiniana]|uniref:Glucose-6-phosphate 1-epimerase n=1 Tax=Chlorella sorokiniana TaxID=3076 RepID=A0A2P6TJU0_CHLSO|nr:Glucose-6-phosphate 1-epimerase [Chlorella sorokiniana]|eukprot:PRW44333.1 Glucose-6-phosphate 1-epimerase [Chlorella sorokiniana]
MPAGTCAAALPAAALGVAAQAAAGRPPPAAACTPRRQPRRRAARSSVAAAGYNYNIDDIVYQTIKQQSWETPPEARGGADGVQPPSSSSLSPEEAEAQWEANQEYIAHCNATYGVPGLIEFAAGYGGLPKAVLQHPSGTRAEVYLHGGTVTSWRHADGREMLHLRRGNVFDGVEPISGGIQIAWPQYGSGPLPRNGFLQNLHWSVVETAWRQPEDEQQAEEQLLPTQEGSSRVVERPEDCVGLEAAVAEGHDLRPMISLYAETDSSWAEQWPYQFEALYTVSLMEPEPPTLSDVELLKQAHETPEERQQREEQEAAAAAAAARAAEQAALEGELPILEPSVLRCVLQIHNSGDEPFTFTTGLRSHFVTRDIQTHGKYVNLLGLRGKYVMDYTQDPLNPGLTIQEGDLVRFGDREPLDLAFLDCEAGGEVLFCPGAPAHFSMQNLEGFCDIGVQHPTAVLPCESRHFVTMGPARAVRKVTLQPGELWVGDASFTAHDDYWPLAPWEMEDPTLVPVRESSPEFLPGWTRARRSASVLDD